MNRRRKQQQIDTLLLKRAQTGTFEQVKDALSRGASVDARDEQRRTALFFASLRGKLDIARLLVRQGANVNARDSNDNTPLHFVTEMGHHMHIIKFLVEQHANINARSNNGKTPLMNATISNKLNIVRFLVSQPNLLIDARDLLKRTALMMATMDNNMTIIRALIKAHANPTIPDKNGRTVLDIARDNFKWSEKTWHILNDAWKKWRAASIIKAGWKGKEVRDAMIHPYTKIGKHLLRERLAKYNYKKEKNYPDTWHDEDPDPGRTRYLNNLVVW